MGEGIKTINKLLARELTIDEIEMVNGGGPTYAWVFTDTTNNRTDVVMDYAQVDYVQYA
jgi:hypothetical protein